MLLLITGLFVSFAAPAAHVRAGRWTVDPAAGFMLLPLVDMVLFAGFFAAAIVYRRRPEIHKRLIISATVAVSFAAAARIYDTDVVRLISLWLAPFALAALLDLVTRRWVHAVWLISLAVLRRPARVRHGLGRMAHDRSDPPGGGSVMHARHGYR